MFLTGLTHSFEFLNYSTPHCKFPFPTPCVEEKFPTHDHHKNDFISNRENFLRQLWEMGFLSAVAAMSDSSFKEADVFFTLKSHAGFSFSAECSQTLSGHFEEVHRGAKMGVKVK